MQLPGEKIFSKNIKLTLEITANNANWTIEEKERRSICLPVVLAHRRTTTEKLRSYAIGFIKKESFKAGRV